MLTIKRKYRFVKIDTTYFPSNGSKLPISECDLVGLIHTDYPFTGAEEIETFHIHLEETVEELRRKLGKTNRYKINRGMKRDNINAVVITDPSEREIEEFQEYYNKFAKNKNTVLCTDFHVQTLKLLRDQNSLILTYIVNNEKLILGYHVYVGDGKKAMLLYSCSHYRMSEENSSRALIGRANRTLHWQDILWFKENGYSIYDFGGTTKDEGIKRFKSEFGGSVVKQYTGYKPITVLGYLVFLYWKWKRKLKDEVR
ncbi:hypothetical protein LCL95_08715 [Bacillus timonensis]|nr:hypothetical protein [Bacillus timonensis]